MLVSPTALKSILASIVFVSSGILSGDSISFGSESNISVYGRVQNSNSNAISKTNQEWLGGLLKKIIKLGCKMIGPQQFQYQCLREGNHSAPSGLLIGFPNQSITNINPTTCEGSLSSFSDFLFIFSGPVPHITWFLTAEQATSSCVIERHNPILLS